MSKPTIKQAIKAKNLGLLKEAVDANVTIYGAEMPEEPSVETIHGDMKVSLLFDKKSIWLTVIGAYTEILQAVESIPKKADRKVEIAKLVANNGVLRHLTSDVSSKDEI